MSWPVVSFGDVLTDATGGNVKTKQSDYLAKGHFAIVDQGQSNIGGYTDDKTSLCKVDGPVIIFGDHTKALKYVDFPFCLGADGTKVLKPKLGTHPKYLYYALHQVPIPEAGYSRHFKYLKVGKIPLPPLEEQKRIAGILDQAAELCRLRTRALDKLNSLGQAIFTEMFEPQTCREEMLKNLGRVQTGSTPSTKVPEYFDGNIPFLTPGDLESDRLPERHLSREGAEKSCTVAAGATLVCCVGSIGKVGMSTELSAFNQQINAIEWADQVLPVFGYFAMRQIKPEIVHRGKGAATTLPILKKSEFEKLRVRVAALDQQQAFVDRMESINPLVTKADAARKSSEALFASLQHRAFRNEL